MELRAARETDFDAIAEITNHYITTTAIHFSYEPVTAAELRALWTATHERYPWLVTVQDDAVIAYAKAGTWRERTAYRWSCEVGLYVAPDQRGRGIGAPMYRELLAQCATRGFHSALAGITLPNAPSIALHDKLGFTSVGVVQQAGWKHDAWWDVAFYQKLLTTSIADPTVSS